MAMPRIVAYRANVVHSLGLNRLQVLQPGIVGVEAGTGKIAFVEDAATTTAQYDEVSDLMLPLPAGY